MTASSIVTAEEKYFAFWSDKVQMYPSEHICLQAMNLREGYLMVSFISFLNSDSILYPACELLLKDKDRRLSKKMELNLQ